jgi:hypothetical protein
MPGICTPYTSPLNNLRSGVNISSVILKFVVCGL